MKKKKIIQLMHDNRGSAMVVSLVVSLVLLVFALMLLLVSYSLFSTMARKTSGTACKELAKSIDKEIEDTLTVEFSNAHEEYNASIDGKEQLWFYIRYNIWQENGWNYYNSDEFTSVHGKDAAYKYFTIQSPIKDIKQYAKADVSISMYWDCNSAIWSEGDKNDTPLHVRVMVSLGESYYVLESTYMLEVGQYSQSADENEKTKLSDGTINPNGNEVFANEKWRWIRQEE